MAFDGSFLIYCEYEFMFPRFKCACVCVCVCVFVAFSISIRSGHPSTGWTDQGHYGGTSLVSLSLSLFFFFFVVFFCLWHLSVAFMSCCLHNIFVHFVCVFLQDVIPLLKSNIERDFDAAMKTLLVTKIMDILLEQEKDEVLGQGVRQEYPSVIVSLFCSPDYRLLRVF